MIRFLIHRPIATSVVALTLVILGVLVSSFLPVSLLPDIPVPEITVYANYPGADAQQIQQAVTVPLRNQLLQLDHLEEIEAVSNDEQSIVKLRLDYGADVDLAYLETNEKIDILMENFPREMPRPRVVKAGASDIPVFQLNVWCKNGSCDFLEVSSFCESVLRRRLEQLEEIAFADLTGISQMEVLVQPDLDLLQSNGINLDQVSNLIEYQTGEFGNFTIRDGQYEYSISFESPLSNISDISNLYFKIGTDNGRLVRLGDVAKVTSRERKANGLYFFDGNRAVGIALVKHEKAQVLKLRHRIDDLVATFQQEYPQLGFAISQNQTELLDLSLGNLINSLVIGAILSSLMILLFMRDRRLLFLVGLVIPVSLAATLLAFYILGLSINIVSVSGLILGIGEIIDSAIIIVENIEQYREESLQTGSEETIEQSCVRGTENVIWPLFTSVLTNVSVFLPLLFLSGIAGALFFDQAIAVTIALSASLLTSYTLIPVLYYRFFTGRKYTKSGQRLASHLIEIAYNRVFYFSIRRPKYVIFFCLLLTCGFGWITLAIDKKGMPAFGRTEVELHLDWNEPISIEENHRRITEILASLKPDLMEAGQFVGQQQFLLNNRLYQTSSQALITGKVKKPSDMAALKRNLNRALVARYPMSICDIRPALNVFEQIFRASEPPLRLLVSSKSELSPPSLSTIDSVSKLLSKIDVRAVPVPRRQQTLLHFQPEKLILYRVDQLHLLQNLRARLLNNNVGYLRSGGNEVPIVLGAKSSGSDLHALLTNSMVTSELGDFVPVGNLIRKSIVTDFTSLYLGKDGAYTPLNLELTNEDVPAVKTKIEKFFSDNRALTASFSGSYYRNLSYLTELGGIILMAVVMLYFILAAQFESLTQPLIVLLTILFGCAGAFTVLYVFDSSLNIMSAIGIVVLIGLLDNDSILKIDTMNRSQHRESLLEVVRRAGQRRLQSQIMTFLTTILGLMPILWSSGLGAELQKPLALAVVGGMTFGLFISWTFIPLMYYWIASGTTQSRILRD